MGKYFGTDGIRGKAYEKITTSLAFDVGRALGTLKEGAVLVGMDTRLSSKELKDSLIEGIKEAGLFVYDLNIISTPALIYLSMTYHSLAVMITASHNPYTDNGIKVINNGRKLNDKEIDLIENAIGTTIKTKKREIPFISNYEYLSMMKSFDIPKEVKVVFDFSNGALTYIGKEIIDSYSFSSVIINNDPNGRNINNGCGSENLISLKKTVLEEKADMGFAFDGDGDRVKVVDKDGLEYDGDALIYAIAVEMMNKGKLKKDSVVFTEDINPGILKSLSIKGIKSILTDVGDRNVADAMEKADIMVGGEASGHIILRKYSKTGDGLLTALYLLEMINKSGKDLKSFTGNITLYPIIRKNLRDFDMKTVESDRFQNQIRALKNSSDDYSLILVRKSGTENLLRITVSFSTQEKCDEYMKVITDALGGNL